MPMRLARSFRSKLLLLVVMTSALAALFVGGLLITRNTMRLQRRSVDRLRVEAEIVSINSAAPLTFGDVDAATETLGALRAEPNIAAASLREPSGREFANYHRGDLAMPSFDAGTDGERRIGQWLILERSVMRDQVRWIYDRTHLRKLTEKNGRDSLALAVQATDLADRSGRDATPLASAEAA